MTSNALHTKWMVSLTLPFWEHCSKVASQTHTLKLRADQPEFDWPFPIIVKEIFTDFRTVKTVVNLFSFDLLHKGLIRRSTRGKHGLIVSPGAGEGWLSALTMINAQSLPCLEVWMKGMKG